MRFVPSVVVLALSAGLSVHAQEVPAPKPRIQLASGSLATLSPKGDKVLSVHSAGEGVFAFVITDLESKDALERTLLDVQASSDDQLAYLTNGGERQWSPDGERVGVATTKGGVSSCGIASLTGGEAQWLDAPVGTYGLCFAPEGGGGWFVEGSLKGRAAGVKVRAFGADGKAGEAVLEDAERAVALVEPSPKGTHLALLIAGTVEGRPALRIGVLELATKKLVESGPVRTDDHFLKPRLRWTPDGSALVLTTRGAADKWPANIVRCDAATGALHTLVEAGPWAVAGVLASGEVCLYDKQAKKVALLDPKAGGAPKEVAWPAVVLQQSGGRSLLYSLERRGVWVD